MKTIIISGTPGTGKSSVAKKIGELTEAKIISLNELAISGNFKVKYDTKRDTQVINTEKFLPYIVNLIEDFKKDNPDYIIIEGHFSDILPEKYIDYAIILRCDPDILNVRLKKRNYSHAKIIENLQSEILGSCANYFIEKKLNVPIFEINTTELSIESIAEIILDSIVGDRNAEKYMIGKIDWLEKIFQEDRMNDFFNGKE